ncbi:neurensin 1-like [Astyanax mexicanus]|uniref:Neurensin-1-like n=2 Tax=Astyanax mexicanus TaxID=7994 RepID=A0A8B9L373_ASTMX|nr:neurensin 1-like [Astyanax mexicanus]XP_022538890.1 neurensin 1-like [Astyanax mexicanus]KAG9279647.1 neurensin-1-like [Astyanax mexicanus]
MASCPEVSGSERAARFKRMAGSGCHGFGVRSYLHHFYECTASMWEQEDAESRSASPQWWSSGLCKVSLAFGAVVLAVGLVVLTVGFAIPSRIEAFGEGELLFVDRQAVQYNQGLHMCVQAGTGMLSLGGLLMAAGLLVSAFSKPVGREGERSPQTAGRERKGVRGAQREPSNTSLVTKAPSPAAGDGAVPVSLSKVENVQPTL